MVKNLKSSDIKNKKIKGVNKHGMLLIYAEWCGHCHRFIPDFEKIDSLTGSNYICAKIEDKQLNPKLMKELGVNGFPTIKFFDKNGYVISDYPNDQQRTVDNILSHICKTYHYCIKNRR